MAPVKKTIEFTTNNAKAFTGWLKRFASIDTSLLLEIDEKTSNFIAKTYNNERSVVKMSSISFVDAGLTVQKSTNPKRIKAGIYNILRLNKIIDQFNDIEFTMTVTYNDIISGEVTQYAAENILLKSKNLKMNVDCTSLEIFKNISDDRFINEIAKVDTLLGTFELTKANLEKINSLCTLDNEYKYMDFKIEDNNVFVSGKTFEFTICETTSAATSTKVHKEQYGNVDIENYNVELGEEKIVFKSKDSDTICVISKATDED